MGNELDDMRDIVNDRLRRVKTACPGRILSYDASTRKAEVEPLVQEKYADGTLLTPPRIANVPVVMPSTANAGLVLPVGNGDPCLLVFAQRSMDRWLAQGGVQEPADSRMHATSDAIAIVGLFPFSVSHSDGSGLRLHNDNGNVRVEAGATPAILKAQSDAKIALGTAAVELLDEITKALDDIVTGLLTIPYTPTITQAASAAIKTIKGSLP